MISVIIPTYNRAGFVCRAIESVQRQTYSDVEIIVVDDGSTDDTQSVLGALNGITVLRHEENKGPSAARNTGIKASGGEYIALLDSDDEWLPEKLEKQISRFLQSPEISICHAWWWYAKPEKTITVFTGDIFYNSLLVSTVLPTVVVFKKKIIDRVGLFDEGFPQRNDYEFFLRVAAKYDFMSVPEILAIKHTVPGGCVSGLPHALRYEIKAIYNLMRSGTLTAEQTQFAKSVFRKKTGEMRGYR